MRQLRFEGTPQAIGEAFGESMRDAIAELYQLRVKNALLQAKEYGGRTVDEKTLLDLSRACLPVSEAYDPEGYAELVGIARGAKLPIEKIFAMNGLTDLRDVLAFGAMLEEGCSSFIVGRDLTEDGRLYLGQTWDLATDNMPFVVAVHRKPKGRPATWSMTTAGCLSLIGMNEDGAAIGTTNIRTKDSKVGVTYLQIIHRALREKSILAIEPQIVDAPRAGAHYYFAADDSEEALAVECTATRAEATHVTRGHHVHCNHILDENNKAFEAATPYKSSACRQARMGELIARHQKPIALADLQRFLADHDNGQDAICRHDYLGISSNGSVIMCPKTRRLWTVHGQACTGTWVELRWS